MGWKITDLQGAALPLTGNELLEVTQGENSRSVRVLDLLPGFDDSLAGKLADPTVGPTIISYREGTLADALNSHSALPFKMGQTSATARDWNKSLYIDALASGLPVNMPSGKLYTEGGITLPPAHTIKGAGFGLTEVLGDGDIFIIPSDPGVQSGMSDFSIANDSVNGVLISVASATASQGGVYERMGFGKSVSHIVSSAPDLVGLKIDKCRFNAATGYSRQFKGLWAYDETKCYTWYNGGGLLQTGGSGTTCQISGSVFEYNKMEGIQLLANGADIVSWNLNSVHFEGNDSNGIGAGDIIIRTASANRVRSVEINGCSFFEGRASQVARILAESSGGGNIALIVINGGSVVGAVPLTNNNAAFIENNVYRTNGAPADSVGIGVVRNSALSSDIGTASVAGANAGNSATIATITAPTGSKSARVTVRGNYYNGVANSHTGYLEAHLNLTTGAVIALHDINNAVGSAQGFKVAFESGAVVVLNKTGMSATQSGDIVVSFFK